MDLKWIKKSIYNLLNDQLEVDDNPYLTFIHFLKSGFLPGLVALFLWFFFRVIHWWKSFMHVSSISLCWVRDWFIDSFAVAALHVTALEIVVYVVVCFCVSPGNAVTVQALYDEAQFPVIETLSLLQTKCLSSRFRSKPCSIDLSAYSNATSYAAMIGIRCLYICSACLSVFSRRIGHQSSEWALWEVPVLQSLKCNLFLFSYWKTLVENPIENTSF